MSRTSIVQYFLIAGVAFFFFVTPNGRAFADCSFEVLPSSGFSIVCTNTITEGITGTDQADIIRFLPQASLIYHVTNAGNSSSLATVIGIEGLQGNDEVINAGDIEDLLAQAETTAESVSLTIDDSFIGDVTGSVVSDSNATADATAIGIDGGPGNDRIDNQATISADVDAIVKATDVAVNINVTADGTVTGASASNAGVVANAKAIGIDGDDNNDSILNSGDMELHADAEAEAVSVSLVVSGSMEGNVDGDTLSDASVAANALATGFDGGLGMDTMTNYGAIVADVDSSATAVGVSVDVAITAEGTAEGASVSDASVTASATATGMDGGEDDDVIDNRGDVDLKANADAVGVAVSLTVAGTAKGDAEGESVSDASATSAATVTGISGGGGDDSIISDGAEILADVISTATSVSVGLTVTGSMEGNVAGEALSDGSATANATATGISGGLGIDTISNRANIFENVDAGATTVAVGADVAVSIEEGGNAIGAALSDAGVLANAAATGIDGGDGGDAINNRGDIGLLSSADGTGVAVSLNLAGTMKGDAFGKAVSDAGVTAHATASGIDGGDGGDAIVNEGTITLMNGVGDDTIDAKATAVGVSLDISGSMEGNVEGEALSDSSAAANAEATGIYGGRGIDTITNYGAILAAVDTSATAVGVSVDVGLTEEGTAEGAALSNAGVLAQAEATGIDAGDDADDIDNRGAIALLSSVEATGVAVSLDIAGSMKGDALGKAVSDAGVTADATATGIAGGDGNDTIVSDGSGISADVDASATAVSVGLTVSGSMEGNVAGEALTDGSAMANATATGIDGGLGIDAISNRADIFENVDAGATTVAVGVDVAIAIEEGGNATGAALSDAGVTANAAAGGIDGGGDADAIDNRGDIALLSNSDATGVAVSLTVAGTMKGDAEGSSVSDASVMAMSTATGIDGGEGDDMIDNEGMISLMNGVGDDEIDAGATAVSVALTVSGSMEGNVAGEALSDSSATAAAMATGIDGGSGIDEITNRGAIVGNVDSSATAVGVGLDVSLIIAKEGDAEGNVSGAALSDASVTATSLAAGIDGGEGTDDIDNRGDLSLSASTDATGVAVSLAVAGSVACKGGVEGEISGKALSNASTAAYAETTGIDGGEDSDQIINTGNFSLLQAEANSTGVSAAVDISAGVAADGDAKVNVEGTAVSDARVTAEATTSAIRGGGGEDEIINTGDFVNLKSASDAISVAASLNITGALAFKGDADASTTGSAVSAASGNALATTVAIDGGAGNDIIRNTGNIINLESDSTATSVSAGVNVSAVVAIKGNAEADVSGEAVGDSRVISRALTLGLAGGLGDDEIDNEGDISLLSTADATGVAAELNVSASLNFKGFSMSDVSGAAASNSAVSAKAEAIGIDGGWGRDTIRNSGDITLMNGNVFDADAFGLSASLNISGNVAIKGVAAGTVVGTAASNATVTAEATATGINGGGDNDIIDNTGVIKLLPSSNADGIAASLNVSGNMVGETEGAAMSDATVIATSMATGIDGGEGNDIISNEGAITLMKQGEGEEEVDANALGIAASLNITGNLNGTAEGQALSKATTTAAATAIGIDGGSGTDDITNRAAITADVDSEALGVAAALGISIGFNGSAEGAALSDVSVTAEAAATGIGGGEGADMIANEKKEGSESSGDIELFATADAESVAVSVGITGTMRGTAEGKTVADSSAKANSTATGLDGGSGEDDITNMANIFAGVDSYAKAVGVSAAVTVAVKGTAEGAALSDVSAESFSSATGIDGAEDNDTIDNRGLLNLYSFSDSQTTAVSVSLTGTMGGVAEGKAASDGSAKAISESTGIDGGRGDDVISSSINKITTFSNAITETTSVSVSGGGSIGLAKNASVANASSISEAHSTAIDGGQGIDTIENSSEIESTARADAEATATSVAVTIGLGSASTTGTADSSATARANATGIEGGSEDDEITNTGAITVGGFETLGPMASAQAGATTVTVGLAVGLNAGEASSNAAAIAEVNAAGISGGSGDDWIDNTGIITVGPDSLGTGSMANAGAKSTTVKVGVTLGASLGKSSSDTSSTAVANLSGIKGGSGNDTVYNSGVITTGTDPYEAGNTAAMATANAASETVDISITVGGSFSDASSNASATAQSASTGIETDAGKDRIDNSGVINAFSSSEAVGLGKTTTASLTIGASEGSAQSNASSLSTALATGIDSGADADEIYTASDVIVKARAISTTLSEATNYNILSVGSALQSAEANSSSTAEAIARGIDGGTGADTITASGIFDLTADTLVDSTSRSSTVTGLSIGYNVQEAQSRAGTVSDALAVGIDGGEGNDVINSTATLTVNTLSNAVTTATSSSNTGFNIAGSSSGESVAGATSEVTASGIGIRGGTSVLAVNESDADVIINEGPISVTTTVTANTQSTSTADSITFIGKAEGTAVSDASATVLADGIGIDGGADNDRITSKNTITVKTIADASVKSTSNVDSYATFGGASSMGVSDASANVSAAATGISGGTGDDIITSRALVEVEAESVGSVSAISDIDADVTFGGASSKAVSAASVTKQGSATGIDGGAGGDLITNYDRLNVRAISAGTVTSTSRASADATFGSTSSITTTAAALEGAVDTAGIIGGSGADRITNLGRIDSIADANLHVKNSSVSTADSTFGSSDARAFSVSTLQGKASSLGISGDDGNDLIENGGVVNVRAIANTTVDSVTVAIADSFWGSEYTEAASSNFAAGESTAKGITTGAGNDEILNTELITVEAGGTVTITSAVYSSDGPASSDARTMALAHASGIDSGADDDNVTNAETILVTAAPRILSATRTFGSGGKVDGKVGILLDADAQGIAGGGGDDLITNEGNILVFLSSPETESTVSEDATSGATTFTDNKRIGEDPEAIAGRWVRIQASDDRNFVTSVDAFDPATGTFTLHDPITYDLTVNDDYTLYDYGDKTPDIESVQVTVGGRTRVDASTIASLRATGIEGGDGDDEIMNSGAIEVKASNLIKTVSVTIGRDIDADSNTESTVNAIGIAGDGKADTSTVTKDSANGTAAFIDAERIGEDPDAIVGKRIRFKTGAAAAFFTIVEGFDPETGTFTLRDPIPEGGLSTNDIYALGGGSNAVTNTGTIDVNADAAIDASGWVLNFGGSPNIESEGRTQAISTGVQGGEYDDFFKNTKRIETHSSADVTSVQRATVIFGAADQELVFEARSESVGMSTGAGDDIIVNGEGVSAELAAIDVDANATANVDGVTTSIFGFGETNNLVDARSVSTATGLDLGEGQNDAYNTDQINVSAESITTANATSDFNLFEEANARANAAATALASGIRAEDGGDMVQSSGAITVDATAAADSFAQGSDVIGGSENDFNSAVTEDSSSGSMTFIDASLISEAPEDIAGQWVRFLTGDNENFTTLVTGFDPGTGTVILDDPLPAELKAEVVDDDDNIVTPADEYTLANGRDGESGAFANAFATGIDLNNGLVNSDTVVEIEGTLDVTAYAQADSTAYAYYNGSANAGATATAEARGIVTGDGNDVVSNDGTIRVEAEALTSASGAGVTENITATATGIDTGAGNDTIWNGGSIITGEKEDDSIIAGNAILTGPGNDTVILGDLSSTVGHIDLGADNDILHLIGSPVVSGNILPDTDVNSIDALIFEGQGSFANSLQGFDRATKQKAGIYSVASLPSLQRMEMIEGTLQINSDYTFAEDGLFLAHIYSDSSHGKLQVIGNAVLDGELQALRSTGVYLNGTKYNVLEGTSVDAESHFSNVVVPEPSTLLSFDVHQLSNAVEVEVLAKSFTTVAKEKSHLFIAQYLDKVMLTATGDLSNIIGELQLLPADEFSAAFSSLIPRVYEQSGQVTFSASGQYINTVHNHMNSFRRSAGLAEEWRNKKGSKQKPILLAYNGSLLSIGSLLDPDDSAQRETEFGMWIRGIGQWGEQDKKDGFIGYDYDTGGLSCGFDWALNPHVLGGFSLGHAYTDLQGEGQTTSGDLKSTYLSAYGTYFTEKGYLESVLSYGLQSYDNWRRIAIGDIDRQAFSNHDGHTFSAFLRGGYNFDRRPWVISPYAALKYINLSEDAFKETGAGAINLTINGRDTDSLSSEIGARFQRVINVSMGALVPELSLAWNYDFAIDDRIITAGFADSPGTFFPTEAPKIERNSVVVETGISLINRSGFTTHIQYAGTFRKSYREHSILGELRYEF